MKYLIEKNKTVFKKSVFELREVDLEIDTFANGREKIHRFELNVPEVIAALVYVEDTDEIVLVEQFRYSSIKKCSGWVMEIVAGLIENNEAPETSLKREVLEESGYQVREYKKILNFFPNVGFSNQYGHFYFVTCKKADKVESGGGLKAEKEDIKVHSLATELVREKVINNEFNDSKTIIALQWFFLNHKTLK